jgi:hypothetical protein
MLLDRVRRAKRLELPEAIFTRALRSISLFDAHKNPVLFSTLLSKVLLSSLFDSFLMKPGEEYFTTKWKYIQINTLFDLFFLGCA